jgi:protein-tyrosine phosphatase
MSAKKKILFICTGNICRSPLAHALFEQQAEKAGLSSAFEVESAGTTAYHVGEQADDRMRATAARRGSPFSHRARKLSHQDLSYYDYLFVMDHGHLRQVRNMAASAGLGDLDGKLRMFREFDPEGNAGDEVPDPWYGGQDGFDLVYDIVHRTSGSLLEAFDEGRL